MTEKRFTLDGEENGLCKCILMNGEEIPTCEVVELLNKLAEENEQYKRNSISLKQLYKILEENKEHFLSLSECFSEKLFIKTIFRNIDEDIESREEEK